MAVASVAEEGPCSHHGWLTPDPGLAWLAGHAFSCRGQSDQYCQAAWKDIWKETGLRSRKLLLMLHNTSKVAWFFFVRVVKPARWCASHGEQ